MIRGSNSRLPLAVFQGPLLRQVATWKPSGNLTSENRRQVTDNAHLATLPPFVFATGDLGISRSACHVATTLRVATVATCVMPRLILDCKEGTEEVRPHAGLGSR
jgi:hypothetical protein